MLLLTINVTNVFNLELIDTFSLFETLSGEDILLKNTSQTLLQNKPHVARTSVLKGRISWKLKVGVVVKAPRGTSRQERRSQARAISRRGMRYQLVVRWDFGDLIYSNHSSSSCFMLFCGYITTMSKYY